MENALYYTLSTIAQTLAGALAVSVAFMVSWLSKADWDIQRGRTLLSEKTATLEDDWKIFCERGLEVLGRIFEKRGSDRWASLSELEVLAAAYAAHKKRSSITRPLKTALGWSALAIAVCFAALPFTPVLGWHYYLGGMLLFVAVALGLVCLGLYVRLIGELARETFPLEGAPKTGVVSKVLSPLKSLVDLLVRADTATRDVAALKAAVARLEAKVTTPGSAAPPQSEGDHPRGSRADEAPPS